VAGPAERRRGRGGFDAWPGYVDALSTLLMVIIFVLLVFVVAQAFLSSALSTREQAVEVLNRRVAELAELLALEAGQSDQLRQQLGRAQEDLGSAAAARDAAQQALALLRDERDRLLLERDGLRIDRDRLGARLTDLDLSARGAGDRAIALDRQLAEALARAESVGSEAARIERDLRASRAELAAAQATLDALRREAAALDRQVRVERESVTAKLSEIARLSEQIRALTALRDELERRAAAEQRGREAAETAARDQARLAESAAAQIALLTRQTEALRAELARLARALEVAEATERDRNAQITLLGQRLNAALAARVEELQRYRSNFFGRLREVLGERPEVRIVGDRFVFQGEVLFAPANAELSEAGQRQVRALAGVLSEVIALIPPDIAWVLRIDGHADRTPIRSPRFASNWELAAARAIAVAQMLIAEGLPANRVAATSFGDTQPLEAGDSPQSLARNRRIEIRLTDR